MSMCFETGVMLAVVSIMIQVRFLSTS